jgi:mono/diheme cytochrome c family protein
MAPVHLTDAQTKDLVALRKAITPDNGDVIDTAPDFAAAGATLYQKNFCGSCHAVNGEGGKMGPALNGLSTRRTEAWVVEHFENPRKMSPGTPMPAYPFARPDMQNMVSYLFTLPDKAP